MGLPEEGKDIPGAGESSLAGGKDLLYGWLVGRAAADLGLAQALAISEAQRSEQIKRLEESLLGQIRALQKSETANDGKGSADLDALKVELQRVSASQQQLLAERIHVEELEAVIRGKLHQFESQIQPQGQGGTSGDLGDTKFELKLLADRIARAEYTVQQAQAQAASQSQRVEEIVADRLKAETATLKTQLAGELDSRMARHEQAALIGTADLKAEIGAIKTRLDESKPAAPGDDLAVKKLEESLAVRIGELQEKLAAALSALERRDAEMAGLDGQLSMIDGRLAEFAKRSEDYAERTRALEGRLSERLEAGEKSVADFGQLQIDLSNLLNRMTQFELSYQQAQASSGAEARQAEQVADGLRLELAALKADLGQQAMVTAQSILANVEEMFGGKINELQSCFLRAQQDSQGRDGRLSELQGEIHVIAQRLVQAESSTQQTHALLVNEAAQSAQLRDGVMSEFTALQGQLAEQQAMGAAIDSLGQELGARIDHLQNQLSRSIATLESRDAEIAELKSQMQNLSQSAILKSATPAATVNRPHAPIGVTVGLGGVKAPSEAMTPALRSAAAEPNTVLQSYDAEADGPNEQKKHLQQRISADIERVRAELRKRAGVNR